jgi:transcriptional regulator with XRE-family HTH domain
VFEVSGVTITEPIQLGTLIRRFRLAAGLSQEELAERSGLSARAISDLERGLRSHTRPETLRMLSAGLELSDDGRAELLAAARPELRTSAGEDTPGSTALFAQPTIDLPDRLGPLIGRDQVVADLVSELNRGEHRLITLTGPGGVGKTRLAVEVAYRAAPAFSGGVAFVDLTPVTEPELVASTIAHTLGIHESRDRPIAETLGTALAMHSPFLVLLDNFEQVIGAAPLIGNLLSASDLHLLVTSREALRLRTEHEVAIPPLDLPSARVAAEPDQLAETPAVALFVIAAARAKPGFALSEENAPGWPSSGH